MSKRGETEQAYFEAVRILFQLTTAEVVVADNTKGAAPISVVECAEERAAEQGGYDTIERARGSGAWPAAPGIDLTCTRWCRFRASNSGFFSIPSGPIDPSRCVDVIGQIRREHLNGYAKADDGVTKQLMLRVETALANARWLKGRTEIQEDNPSTSVNTVVQHMKDVGSRRPPV
jgi:hypothetical protein